MYIGGMLSLSLPLSFVFTTSDSYSGGSENGHNGLPSCWRISRARERQNSGWMGKAPAFYSR